jgi:RimJ/RimL family protein N-acetyltransferase
LLKCAASHDVQFLHASVGADNQAMQALALRCGFSVRPDRDDAGLVRVQVAVPAGIQALVPPEHGRPNWLRRLLRRQTH